MLLYIYLNFINSSKQISSDSINYFKGYFEFNDSFLFTSNSKFGILQ